MSGPRWSSGFAVALGVVLLVDALRVFLPSVVTVFGMAASTPAELLGAFALAWFVLPLLAVRFAGRLGWWPAVALGALRVALQFAGGGRPQLWIGALALLAGLVWLVTVAVRGVAYRGFVAGLAASAVLHGALGTVDLAWRGGVLPAVVVLALAGAFAWSSVVPAGAGGGPTGGGPAGAGGGPGGAGGGAVVGGGEPVGGRVWWVALPAVLLWGALAGSPSLVAAAVSYLAGSGGVGTNTLAGGTWAVKALVAASVAAFLWAALSRPVPWRAALALVAGTVLGVAGAGVSLVPAVLLVATGLGGCLAAAAVSAPGTPARRGYRLALGGIGMAVAAVLHYASYDLGFDNRPVFPLVALGIAAAALLPRRSRTAGVAAGTAGAGSGAGDATDGGAGGTADGAGVGGAGGTARPGRGAGWGVGWRVAAVVGVVALLVVDGGRWGSVQRPAGGDELRVVAYNVRMGFGLDGVLDPDGVAALVAAERPDVVLLSEVDRGWWLNGGHDGVAVLAERLGMAYWFAPAADTVWGDAMLTRLPVVSVRTEKLTADGAPTGAQALGVVLRLGDREVAVVSTHLQPAPEEDPVTQAREVAALAAELGRDRPVVVGGDLNTEPGDPAFQVLLDSGLTDALAGARPVPTSPADEPSQQIDHVLVSPGVTAAQVGAPRATLSDHLAVSVTLTF